MFKQKDRVGPSVVNPASPTVEVYGIHIHLVVINPTRLVLCALIVSALLYVEARCRGRESSVLLLFGKGSKGTVDEQGTMVAL
jgi:hypothetical protein